MRRVHNEQEPLFSYLKEGNITLGRQKVLGAGSVFYDIIMFVAFR